MELTGDAVMMWMPFCHGVSSPDCPAVGRAWRGEGAPSFTRWISVGPTASTFSLSVTSRIQESTAAFPPPPNIIDHTSSRGHLG